MKRILVTALIPLLAALVVPLSAQARLKWCKADPIIRLNGTHVQILVHVPEEDVPRVNGPIAVEAQTPASVKRELLYTDPGFNGHGETVSFSDLPGRRDAGVRFPTKIDVRVPIQQTGRAGGDQVPVQVTIIPENARTRVVRGTSTRTVTGLAITGTTDTESWKRSDRTVSLDGTPVRLSVAIPERYVPMVNGPVRIEVIAPKAVARELVLVGQGYNGYGETLSFVGTSGVTDATGIRTRVRVRIPVNKSRLAAGETVPVEVTAVLDDEAAVIPGIHTSATGEFSVRVRGSSQ